MLVPAAFVLSTIPSFGIHAMLHQPQQQPSPYGAPPPQMMAQGPPQEQMMPQQAPQYGAPPQVYGEPPAEYEYSVPLPQSARC